MELLKNTPIYKLFWRDLSRNEKLQCTKRSLQTTINHANSIISGDQLYIILGALKYLYSELSFY